LRPLPPRGLALAIAETAFLMIRPSTARRIPAIRNWYVELRNWPGLSLRNAKRETACATGFSPARSAAEPRVTLLAPAIKGWERSTSMSAVKWLLMLVGAALFEARESRGYDIYLSNNCGGFVAEQHGRMRRRLKAG